DELLLGALEVVDFLDLLVERLDLGPQLVVAVLLRLDHRSEHEVGGEGGDAGGDAGRAERHQEMQLALLALAFTPGEQVYAWHISRNSAVRVRRPSAAPWHRVAPPAPWRARTASSGRAGRPFR